MISRREQPGPLEEGWSCRWLARLCRAFDEELVGQPSRNANWRTAPGRDLARGVVAKACSPWLAQRNSFS